MINTLITQFIATRIGPRFVVIFCLVFAGEMIFSLPFHVPRFFRPTMLDVFNLSNAALGDIFAVYGITAMLAYFPGGVVADWFSARKLMAFSLFATAAGGLYMARLPDNTGLAILYAYWGVTSILLFWAAMIRATREWGGVLAQGRAFGILDGGRGLVAAGAASLAVWIFSSLLPADLDNITDSQRGHAFHIVIYFYSGLSCLAGVLVWFCIPHSKQEKAESGFSLAIELKQVLGSRVIWLQSVIVICAYSGFKGLDNYALYAVEVLSMNEVEASQFSALGAYLRPVAAVSAGLIADKWLASRVIKTAFALLILSYLLLALLSPMPKAEIYLYANLILTFCAVFALRGIYFALLEETKVARNMTGAAVGVISVIGYLPDVFFASIAGRLLDSAPGVTGHQYYFMFLSLFALIGMAATFFLVKQSITKERTQKVE